MIQVNILKRKGLLTPKFLIWVCTITLVTTIPSLSFANDYENRLKTVKEDLNKAKREEQQLKLKKKGIIGQLQKIEKSMERSRNRLEVLKRNENSLRKRINLLEKGKQYTKEEIEQKRGFVGEKLNFIYKHKEILFNPSSSYKREINSIYLKSIIMEDMYNIEKLISIKDSLQKGKIKIGKELANLQSLKKLQEKEKGNIKREKAKKRYLLKQVKSQLTERQKFIKELEKSRESLEGLIARMRSQKSKKKFEGMIWPCGGIVVSKFGTVIDPEYGTKLINNGIDIKAPLETLVKVAMDGRVVYADRFYGYGKMILVDHNNSFYTLYAHLSKIGVTKGDYVKRGETIGSVGTTGTIEKPALHFELRINGKAVDPLKWMGSN